MSKNKYDLEYFAERTEGEKWGQLIEDDKYWDEELLLDNFLVFYVYAFAHLGLPAPSRMQLEIASYVANREHMHRLVWSPRGIAKSLTSEIYCVWRLANDPDEHILVLSQSSKRAKAYTQFVKKLIALLPLTRLMSPRNNIERTSGESFDIVGATPSDSPSVYASGVGNSIAGMRASILIIDDIETHITVQSLPLIERSQHGVDEAHNLLMSGKDESITLATPHSQNSIYLPWLDTGTHAFICPAKYPANDMDYMGFLAPFIKERIKNDPSLVGRAIDERLNEQFLREKELKIGRSNFKLQYMCDVSEADNLKHPLKLSDLIVDSVSDDDAPLKIGYSSMPDKMLFGVKHNGFKADKLYQPLFKSDERARYEQKIMFIDPAGRGKDETGIAIVYTLNTRIFIKKVTGINGGYEADTMETVANMCALHGVKTLVIESNFGDGALYKAIQPYIRALSPETGIVERRATGQKEIRIIRSLEPLLNQHRIIIDKDTLEKDSQSPIKYTFTYQFSHITEERNCLPHDDRLDALDGAVRFAIENLSNNEGFGFKKLEQQIGEENLKKTLEVFRPRFFNENRDDLVF